MFGGQASTYAYVNGDPLDNTDPLGLCDQDKCKQLEEKIRQVRDGKEIFGPQAR
jgi:hypothetical protein